MFDDYDEITWRTITETIRHVAIIFIAAFVIAVVVKGYGIFELVHLALDYQGLSGIFYAIMVYSVPIYFLCVVIDTIDTAIIYARLGDKIGVVADFFKRILYDITYIFLFFKVMWKWWLILFIIAGVIAAIGLLFLI